MKYYLFALIISLAYALLAYFVSLNLYVGIATLAFFLLSSFFLIVPQYQRHEEKERKRHECFRFINAFVITLSVSQSGEEAFKSATMDLHGEEKELLDAIASLSLDEKIDYLTSYFERSSYAMFVSIYRLYEEQGGDVLKLAEPLLKEITRNEEGGNAKEKARWAGFGQFTMLWGMSYLVFACIRFGLKNYYLNLAHSVPFLLTAIAYFAIALASFLIYACVHTEEPLRLGRKKDAATLYQEKTR
jgi:hypothetical protein